jgi:hypothetical protein
MKRNLYLSPDAELGGDPLDENVNDIDTSFPVLAPGVKHLTVTDATVEPTNDGLAKQLVIKLKTVNPELTIKGETQEPGFPLTARRLLEPKGRMTMHQVKTGLARLGKGLGLSVKLSEFRDNPAILVGCEGDWNVTVSKPTAEYPNPSNNVGDPVVRE